MKKTWEGINNVLARKLKNTKPITSIAGFHMTSPNFKLQNY